MNRLVAMVVETDSNKARIEGEYDRSPITTLEDGPEKIVSCYQNSC
jgi:hypothetical protein